MSKKLQNKVCVITGGAGLIGSAFTKICAENGAVVIIADIDVPRAKALAENIMEQTSYKNVHVEKCNITKEGDITKMIGSTLRYFGSIDILVNNAYPKNRNYGRKFEDVSYKDFCDNIVSHIGGYFLITQKIANIMMRQKTGNIVFMNSIYGFIAPKFEIYKGTTMTSSVEYAAAKGGIINLARYLSSYLGPYGIRVNSISPGGVFDNQSKLFVKKYTDMVRLAKQRMASPQDIANALLFLISDQSKYITGQNLVVDGGWTI